MSKKTRAKHRRKQAPPPQRFPWLWAAVAGAILLVAGGVAIIWNSSNNIPAPAVAPEVNGAPRLAVDQALVDEGEVKIETPVRSSFTLSNVGDEPLQILGEPQVELVEGC